MTGCYEVLQRPNGSTLQPESGRTWRRPQRPFGSMWQPVLFQRLMKKLQVRWKRSGDAGAARPAAEAQGTARTVTSRRQTKTLRRSEAFGMEAPWRALHLGPHGQGRRLSGTVHQTTLRHVPDGEEGTNGGKR